MAVLAEEAGGADHDVDAVDTGLDSSAGILEVAPDVYGGWAGMIRTENWGSPLIGESDSRVRILACGSFVSAVPEECKTGLEEGREHTFKPSLQIASQSRRDCSDATGDVSSM